MKALFPWHVAAFNTIVSQLDRLPPGLLLVGGRGAGKLRHQEPGQESGSEITRESNV